MNSEILEYHKMKIILCADDTHLSQKRNLNLLIKS